MKRLVAPTLVLIGFFALIYAILISTAHTTTIAIFGAGYSVLLLAIYMLIIAIKNPNFSIWWPLSDNAAPAEHWETFIANTIVCCAVCISSFQLPKENFSELPIVYFATVPILVAIVACFIRRLIAKHKDRQI